MNRSEINRYHELTKQKLELAATTGEIKMCYNIIDKEEHVFIGIEIMAKQFNEELKTEAYIHRQYSLKKYFIHDGIKYFQLCEVI